MYFVFSNTPSCVYPNCACCRTHHGVFASKRCVLGVFCNTPCIIQMCAIQGV